MVENIQQVLAFKEVSILVVETDDKYVSKKIFFLILISTINKIKQGDKFDSECEERGFN